MAINDHVSCRVCTNGSKNALDALGTLLHQIQHLIKLGREQVQRGQDSTVRTQVIPCPNVILSHEKMIPQRKQRDTLLHDLFVIHRIANVDVGLEWDVGHCGIEIEDVGWSRGVHSV